ncbi:hypothetical protein SUDANB145_01414 [Streptomyces sp. enrichment culture]|uniref:PDZ domain-containing protein n=1 Tax=Streptomyces sp. enrichment culture TaxID=1795815 RepID=UPI003F575FDF
MEQTVLRPKPMPGRDPGAAAEQAPARPPQPPRRRRRRLVTVVCGALAGAVLVLAGAGIGAMGTTVAGMSEFAELRQRGGSPDAVTLRGGPPSAHPRSAAPSTPASATSPSAAPPTAGATLGVAAVDDDGPGALVVDVQTPGPGHAAGLVRGDLVLVFGTTRVDSAADLARAVARARPGVRVKVTVRRVSGGYEQLTVVPGVVT